MERVNTVAMPAPFIIEFAPGSRSVLWAAGMLILGASLALLGVTGADVLPILAVLAGASSNWSG